ARALQPRLGVALWLVLRKAGRTSEAEGILAALCQRQPNNPELHFHHGNSLAEQKKFAEAVAAFKKGIALQPDFALYNNLGIALWYQKQLAEAAAAFRKAIALQPDLAPAYNNLSNVLADQKKPLEAEAALRQAIALKPDYAEAYNNLGSLLD